MISFLYLEKILPCFYVYHVKISKYKKLDNILNKGYGSEKVNVLE